MSSQINIVIADDHMRVRGLLSIMLRQEMGIRIVAETSYWPQTLHMIENLKPDVLLLNIAMPDMDVGAVIPSIRRKSSDTRILIYSEALDEDAVFEALKIGAKGYISMDTNPSDLIKAVESVYKGELWVSRKQIALFFDSEFVSKQGLGETDETNEVLTPKEKETFRCLTTGCTNKEIAEALFISEKTVKCHMNSIFKKLNVTRRIDATLYALNRGIA